MTQRFGIKRISGFLFVVMLIAGMVGCAATDGGFDQGVQPTVDTTGNESNARIRSRIHTELAAGYFEMGNLGVALESITTALQADSSYHTAHNIAGLIYATLKDDRRAEEHFTRALRLNPADPDANNNYGMYLCQHRREEEGIKYLLIAVQNPLYTAPERSLVNAGVCARRRGDNAAAQDFFRRAVSVRPNQPQALYQLAELSFLSNNFAAAQSYLRRLAQTTAANAEVLWLALRVERKLGNTLAEASFAQQLRNNFPDSREAVALKAGRFE
ncbi:MAG: type IV pilus biogenesis/stability protein PilW [Burkholderiales bacterium]|nr:type IV pilus biogenesis/stability protein PilW [Burkholderiales bacterium]